VDEFRHVSQDQVFEALNELKGTGAFLMFHAEFEVYIDQQKEDGKLYQTFLHSRPKIMENKAIEFVIQACKQTGVRCHIVHLSSSDAIPMIQKAKKEGVQLTVETCFHYLFFDAENIPNAQPEYKCCPPIRERNNRDLLWQALRDGVIDLVVSDHSPCTEDLKKKGGGDYMQAWGGIPSLQWGLSVFHTEGVLHRGFSITELVKYVCENPAKLLGLSDRKGKIEVGFDADLVVFNPKKEFKVSKSQLVHRNKLSPYENSSLVGVVEKTILGGKLVYDDKQFKVEKPQGNLIMQGPSKDR